MLVDNTLVFTPANYGTFTFTLQRTRPPESSTGTAGNALSTLNISAVPGPGLPGLLAACADLRASPAPAEGGDLNELEVE